MFPFLLLALPVVTDADLSLQLSASKTRLLRGEPTKLTLTWSAKRPVEVVTGTERLLLDDGAGFREYREAAFAESALVRPPLRLEPGQPIKTAYEVAVEEMIDDLRQASTRLAFGSPGRYRMKVQYDEVFSNEVVVDVEPPSTGDAAVLARLQEQPELLTWLVRVDPTLRADLDSLLGSHGNSAYLARPRLLLADARFGEAASSDIKAGVPPSEGAARRVLDSLEGLDLSATAFGEDHLLLVAKLTEVIHDLERRRAAYQAVIEHYPNGVAAVKAREWLDENGGDETAPVLGASASPLQIWPPNNRLVPVTVAVTVSDETDPNPKVRLVSVTCDDGCNPAQDIAGATFGTDDREFKLRAKRTGGGSGRTYTITYSATDAAGNAAQQSATVKVPHSQCH